MKTSKFFSKRIKITRQGKVLSRQGGHNHFNAKARRGKQLAKKGLAPFVLKAKLLNHYF